MATSSLSKPASPVVEQHAQTEVSAPVRSAVTTKSATHATIPQPAQAVVAQVARQVQGTLSALDRVQESQERASRASGEAAEVVEEPVDLEEAVGEQEEPAEEHPRFRGRRRANITEEELRRLYIDQNLPARLVAEQFGVSAATINLRLRQFGILKRGPKHSAALPAAGSSGGAAAEEQEQPEDSNTAEEASDDSPNDMPDEEPGMEEREKLEDSPEERERENVS